MHQFWRDASTSTYTYYHLPCSPHNTPQQPTYDEDELWRVQLNTMATRWNHTLKMMAMDPVKQIMMTTRTSNFLEEVMGLNNTTAAAAFNTKWGQGEGEGINPFPSSRNWK
jgi:hypothetical protein